MKSASVRIPVSENRACPARMIRSCHAATKSKDGYDGMSDATVLSSRSQRRGQILTLMQNYVNYTMRRLRKASRSMVEIE
jgi:hypothetical protein